MRHTQEEIVNKALDQLARDPSLIMHKEQTTQNVMFIENYPDDIVKFKNHSYKVDFRKSDTYPPAWEFVEISDWSVSPLLNAK